MQEKEKERVEEKNTWRDKGKERKTRKKTKEKASQPLHGPFCALFRPRTMSRSEYLTSLL